MTARQLAKRGAGCCSRVCRLPCSKSCRDWLRVAAYGRASYVGCLDDRSSHFVVWENRGSGPWKRELEFDGSHDAGQFPLIAGPGGWLLYGEHIRPKTGAPAVRVEGPDTADGGADWSKIPRENGGAYWPQGTDGPYCRPDGPSHCTDGGCQLGRDIRLGWSLGGALPAPMPVAPASIPPVRKLGAPIGLVCTEVDYVPADDPAHAFAFRVGNGAFASTALSCRAATSPARSPASKAP